VSDRAVPVIYSSSLREEREEREEKKRERERGREKGQLVYLAARAREAACVCGMARRRWFFAAFITARPECVRERIPLV